MIQLSELERTLRLDSEFFSKPFLNADVALQLKNTELLSNVVAILDGNHFSISDEFLDEGVPYYRGQNVTGHFFIEQSQPVYIPNSAFSMPHMFRSHLYKGDVLLSIVGTIGELSLVSSEAGATCSCKLAILRPKMIKPGYLAVFLKSCYGQNQIQRLKRGAVQMGLLLEDMDQIRIARFLNNFENAVEITVESAKTTLDQSVQFYQQAETLLLDALNLADFSPSTENSNIKSFQESFGLSGRLDAEYYQPKFDEIEALIKSNSLYYRQVEEIQIYNARGLQPEYVENGNLAVINSKHILEDHLDYENFEKTSAEFWDTKPKARVFTNDILVYTTGANIGRTNIYQSAKKALASNHVNILRIKNEDPYYVAFVMNSFIGRMQTDKLSAGSAQAELYPKDIAQFLIPFVDKTTQQQIRDKIISSLELKKQSTTLLEVAKHAVEIAIEQDEQAALAYIQMRQL